MGRRVLTKPSRRAEIAPVLRVVSRAAVILSCSHSNASPSTAAVGTFLALNRAGAMLNPIKATPVKRVPASGDFFDKNVSINPV